MESIMEFSSDNQTELFDRADDQPSPDPIAPSLLGNLAPIMHPDSLARIEANYQRWLAERRAREQASVSIINSSLQKGSEE